MTPTYLEAQIMDALPQTRPQVITPWWRREFVITPMAAVGGAVALLVVGAAVTVALVAISR